MQVIGKFTAEYKQQFEEYVSLLHYLVRKKGTTYDERYSKAAFLVEEYVRQTGRRPDYKQLDRLSDLLLYDDLIDPDPHKVQHIEYPILSESQLDRRKFGSRDPDTNMRGETSLEQAEYVAADGKDYRYPNRRKRTIDELIFVDENARIRNAERAKQYYLDTRPSRIRRRWSVPFTQCAGIAEKWRVAVTVGREEIVKEPEMAAELLAA